MLNITFMEKTTLIDKTNKKSKNEPSRGEQQYKNDFFDPKNKFLNIWFYLY